MTQTTKHSFWPVITSLIIGGLVYQFNHYFPLLLDNYTTYVLAILPMLWYRSKYGSFVVAVAISVLVIHEMNHEPVTTFIWGYLTLNLAVFWLTATMIWYFKSTIQQQGEALRGEIERHRRTAQELAVSEERFKSMIETTSDWIWEVDARGRYTYCSPKVADILGYTPAELIGTTPFDIMLPSEVERIMPLFQDIVQQKKSIVNLENSNRHRDGHTVVLETCGVPILDQEQNLLGFRGIDRDITDRKKAEAELASYRNSLEERVQKRTEALQHESRERRLIAEKLQAEHAFLQRVLDTAHVIILYLDQTGEVVLINQRGCEILGYSLAEIIGQNWFQNFLPQPAGVAVVYPIFQEIIAGHVEQYTYFENPVLTRQGTERLIAWHNTYLKSSQGKILGTLSSGEDITERKRHEQELNTAKEMAELANRTKSEFLSHMSHELRTPLNGILGYSQILNRQQGLSPEQKKAINTIRQSGEHLLTLINDILDYSRIEARKLVLDQALVFLPAMLQTVISIIKIRTEKKGLDFVYQESGPIPDYINGDEKRLRQILVNLLSNAVKFTERGVVKLAVKAVPMGLRFEISDTGIGIPAEHLDEIFIPFHQVTGTKRQEGTGLGLPISRHLVEKMDSQLQVQSTVGEGTVFWFDLAVKLENKETAATTLPISQIIGYRGQRRRIFIIDDSEVNRVLFCDLLSPFGFEIEDAENGRQALEKLHTRTPDLIMVDLYLPEMNGAELTAQLKTQDHLRHTPFILITASEDDEDLRLGSEAGCVDVLRKPFKINDLLLILARYLQLEWIYRTEHTPEKVDRPLHLPPLEVLQKLRQMAHDGLIVGLKNLMKDLQKEQPDYHLFLKETAHYVHEFELERLEHYLVEKIASVDKKTSG